jgi:hypothetical protein
MSMSNFTTSPGLSLCGRPVRKRNLDKSPHTAGKMGGRFPAPKPGIQIIPRHILAEIFSGKEDIFPCACDIDFNKLFSDVEDPLLSVNQSKS